MASPKSNAAPAAYPLATLPDGATRTGVIRVRHRHTTRFTVVGNHLAQHPDLSAVAIGLGVHILSLPEGAPVTVKALAARFREGEITVRRAMNELVAAGYLERRRVPLGGGRFATRTFAYDRPGTVPVEDAPEPDTKPAPGPVRPRPVRPQPVRPRPARPQPEPAPRTVQPKRPARPKPPPPATGPAADLLARLRLADPRLLLSARDIAGLAPAVDAWLGRAASPDQITRTLTVGLPPHPVPIHHPARFLEYRLAVHLPPPLPPGPPPPDRPDPLINCDGCDRAFRSRDPTARCGDCRDADPPGTERAA
jgi:hypothetical protein